MTAFYGVSVFPDDLADLVVPHVPAVVSYSRLRYAYHKIYKATNGSMWINGRPDEWGVYSLCASEGCFNRGDILPKSWVHNAPWKSDPLAIVPEDVSHNTRMGSSLPFMPAHGCECQYGCASNL